MDPESPSIAEKLADLKVQHILDRLSLYVYRRWTVLGLLFLTFWYRVFKHHGYYVIAYASSIYLLNLFVLFLSPMFDPDDMDDGQDPILPVTNDTEYRPFVRRLPEFGFWLRAFVCLTLSLIGTFFPFLDLQIYVPLLVAYFFFLTYVVLKAQIDHMIKYRYVPFDWGKKVYAQK